MNKQAKSIINKISIAVIAVSILFIGIALVLCAIEITQQIALYNEISTIGYTGFGLLIAGIVGHVQVDEKYDAPKRERTHFMDLK